MLTWMLYAAVIGIVLAAAAAALDAALRLARRATRWAWAAAMSAALLFPALVLLPERNPPARSDRAASQPVDPTLIRQLLAAAGAHAAPAPPDYDAPVVAAWAIVSAALVTRRLVARRRLRRIAEGWRRATVAEQRVRVSPDLGPAVVGAWRPEIVLPAWALDADERALALMLAHEREHARARDPLLLAAANAAAALIPWSPAVWWLRSRLALAVETDCDARVVRRGGDASRYGHLLLDVARRAPARRPLAAISLASGPTHLQRRIEMLAFNRPRHARARALAASTLALALAAIACEVPRPTAPASPRATVALTDVRPAGDAPVSSSLDVDAVREALAERLPEVLTARTGRPQRVWLVQDASGRVIQALRDAAGADAAPKVSTLDPSTIASVDVLMLAPGQVAPDGVAVVAIRLGAPPAGSLERRPLPARTRAAAPVADSGRVAFRVRAPDPRALPSDTGLPRVASADALGADVVRLRGGTASRMKSQLPEPLLVLDGAPLPPETARGTVDALSPDAIASVEVLAGDAAVARFGDRARGGAVVVRSKP